MSATYDPIESVTTGNTNSVTLTAIPSEFTDLRLIVTWQSTVVGAWVGVRVNGDTGTNYSYTSLYGVSSGAGSGRGANLNIAHFGDDAGPTSHTTTLDFLSYSNTNVYKTWLTANALATSNVSRMVNLWRSTDAISSITILCDTWNGNTFSEVTLSLYGIKAA